MRANATRANLFRIIVAMTGTLGGCNEGSKLTEEQHPATVAASDAGGNCLSIVATDWDANDIPTAYYPHVLATDSTGVPNGTSAPWAVALSPSNGYVEVAGPEGEDASIPPLRKGTDWDVTPAPGGGCELIFFTSSPYTVRIDHGAVFIAFAAAFPLNNDGSLFPWRRGTRAAGGFGGAIPANSDLSLYSDAGGNLAIPIGQAWLPAPKTYVKTAAEAVTAINDRKRALGRKIVVTFLAHGNVGEIHLEDEVITSDNAFDKFFGGRGSVTHQRQISCLSGTPATPQILERIADAYTDGPPPISTVGGWDSLILALGFATWGTYYEYHGE